MAKILDVLDREQWRGLAALATVGLATVVGLLGLADGGLSALRFLLPLAAFAVALTIASTNWRPQGLRITALLAVGLLAAVLASVGHAAYSREPTDNAAAEVTVLATAVDALDGARQVHLAALDSDLEVAQARLTQAIGTAEDAAGAVSSPELLTDARAVKEAVANAAAALTAGDAAATATAEVDDAVAKVAAAVAAFAADYPAEPAPVLVDLQGAVEGAESAVERRSDPPGRDDVDDAVAMACAALADAAPDDPCTLEYDDQATVTDELPVALAITRLRLAEYRQALFARDEDTRAVKDAEDALTEAQAQTPAWQPPRLGLLEAVGLGAERVVTGARPPATGLATTVEPAAWLLLGLLGFAFWRWVERRSARQLPGPVEVALTPYASKNDDTSELQKVMFRTAVLRNISEPGAVPGSTALQSLTDLAELVAPAAGWLGKFGAALKNLLKSPVGYSVTGDVIPPPGDSADWTVLVRVKDLAGGCTETVAAITGTTAALACRAAGYWAAAAVLERSTRIPRWARWTPASSTALAAFDDTGSVGAAAPSSAQLAKAVANAPDSGVLLHRWADACDLEGRHLEALSLYARAVAAHPRFPAARYRLAVSVTMLSRSPRLWIDSGSAARTRTAGQLTRAGTVVGLPEDRLREIPGLAWGSAETVTDTLQNLASALFRQIRSDTDRRSALRNSLRSSERDVFWPDGIRTLGREGVRERRRWLVRSAMINTLPKEKVQAELAKVEERAKQPESFWQLSYNLACYYATLAVPDLNSASTWLERTLERPGAGQMAGGWLSTDPDIQVLHGAPRFNWLTTQVDDNRRVARIDA